jgi:hypothetical protein
LLREPLPGETDGLAGEASRNNVNWLKFITPQISNVAVPLRVGPVLRKNTPAVVVDLHLPTNRHARSL